MDDLPDDYIVDRDLCNCGHWEGLHMQIGKRPLGKCVECECLKYALQSAFISKIEK